MKSLGFIPLFIVFTYASLLQAQLPRYIPAQEMYDYQVRAIEAERQRGQQAGLSQQRINEIVRDMTSRFKMQAQGIRPREQRYQATLANYQDYRARMIRHFRATQGSLGRSLSDEEIIQRLRQEGNSAVTRAYYNLDTELAQILDWHQAYQTENTGSSSERLSVLADENRARVTAINGQFARTTEKSLSFGYQKSVGVYATPINPSENNSPETIVGFTFSNDGKRPEQGVRKFSFLAPGNNPQFAGIKIQEDAQTSGGDSHNLMETSLYVIPRRNVPTMRLNEETNIFEVTLPTGEKAYFDGETMRLINNEESVLHSGVQDVRTDRHSRTFADINYRGEGVSIRVDARSGNPEVPRTTTFNNNEQGTQAILTYQGEECRVAKTSLFTEENNNDATFYVKLTDRELNERVLKPLCGWDISHLLGDTSAPMSTGSPVSTPEIERGVAMKTTSEEAEVNTVTIPEIATPVEVTTKSECLELSSDYFEGDVGEKKIDEYLRIQGKITLHRLGLMILHASQKGTDIKKTISDLIEQRNPELHQQFIDSAKQKTRNQRLLMVMGELHEFSQTQEVADEHKLKLEDLFTMELLVKAEKKYGRSYKTGVMDFTSIIRNSLNPRLGEKKEATRKRIQTVMNDLHQQKAKFEQELLPHISNSCQSRLNQAECFILEDRSASNQDELIRDTSPILYELIKTAQEKDIDLGPSFRWNNYWLHVSK
ncbi:MAG: hypothetical protein CME62_13575 [Halobacteriovoraceae bacterium]|nr:hypothetical protein [Halobacteriovoraceae bacterium]|tara:strand:+ start:5420 stop:7558 length:2139 start_codon:yes stop_codon:yes gene_type:complete